MRPPVQVPAALVTCKPLSDPVRLLANILLVAMFLGIVPLVIDFLRTEDKSTVILFVLIISALFISAPTLGMWLLLSASNRTPAIYLRAFRTDRPAHRLRSLLKAALGSRYRICGIRPPHERSSWLVRILGSNFLALRYIGSERFELEAEDHNWMARLLASYARSRLVFIDVRDLTQHVANEIRLSYLAMGVDRCVFVIDSTRAEADWVTIILAALGHPTLEQTSFLLLDYPGDKQVDPKTFVRAVRDLIDPVPDNPVVISNEAIAFAKMYVTKDQWVTPFWEADPALLLISGSGVVMIACLFKFLPAVAVLVPPLGLAFLLAYFIAWRRAWKQGRIEARLPRSGARNPLWRLGLALLLMLIWPLFIAASSISKLGNATAIAKSMRVQADVQAIKTQLQLYESMNGFFPTTEQGLQALVTQPQNDPRPTRWYQLFKELPKDPWGSDYIYRDPGLKNPGGYDLYSAGPDRQPDTSDDDWGDG